MGFAQESHKAGGVPGRCQPSEKPPGSAGRPMPRTFVSREATIERSPVPPRGTGESRF